MANAPHADLRTTIWGIIVVVGILIVVMWAGVGFWLVTARQAALDDASLQARNLMVAFREEIAFILRGIDGEMQMIAEKVRREGDNFDLYAWGRHEVLLAPGMAQATLIGPDGKVKSTTNEPRPPSTDFSDRPHFRVHLDGTFHGLYIGHLIPGRIAVGTIFLPISRRVDAEDGTFLGVLTIVVPPVNLTTLHKMIDLGLHGVMSLSGLDNVIRARFSADSPDGTTGAGKSVAGPLRPSVVPEGAQGSYVQASVVDGIPRLFAYGRVGSYPLVVNVGLELDRALAVWRSDAAMIVGMALGVTLLLIGFAAYLIRRIFADASAARATALAITHTAEHDFLTGLPNRMLLDDRIGQAIAAARRHKNRLAVLFMDLDNFKHINDTLGHPIGDQLLRSVAERLVACVRASDTVSRLGGDEFVALLPFMHRPDDAATIAEKILEAVAKPHSIDRHMLLVTASIGVSIFPDDGPDAGTIVKNADVAMYQAKSDGRNCIRFFRPSMSVQATDRPRAMAGA